MTYRNQKHAMRTLIALAATQGGYFTAKQAEKTGYAYSHLIYHLKAGNFERSGHGLYRVPTLPLSEHDDLIRLSLWSRSRDDAPQAIASHQTALSLYDLSELIPGIIHLTVPPDFRKRSPKHCRLHKRELDLGQVREMSGFKITSPAQTLEDLAADQSISKEQFFKAVIAAADRGLIRKSHVKPLKAMRLSGGQIGPRKASA